MFFKKKMPVDDYCARTFATLFSGERERTWETLRGACNDDALSAVEAQKYYDHLRAVFIQLMLIAITKSFNMDASSDAHVFVMMYLKRHGYSELDEISKGYNQAFASSGLAPGRDGVAQMVSHFDRELTSSKMQQATIERLYTEFYAILKMFFDDFRSMKLVPST